MTTYEKIYATIKRIPKGRVATYGQIAHLAGLGRRARQVGYALAALPPGGAGIPWHRVINAKGEISLDPAERQQTLLESEGVAFTSERIDLDRFQWKPRKRKTKKKKTKKKKTETKTKRKARSPR